MKKHCILLAYARQKLDKQSTIEINYSGSRIGKERGLNNLQISTFVGWLELQRYPTVLGASSFGRNTQTIRRLEISTLILNIVIYKTQYNDDKNNTILI